MSEEDFLANCCSQLAVADNLDPSDSWGLHRVHMRRWRYQMAHPYLKHLIENKSQA